MRGGFREGALNRFSRNGEDVDSPHSAHPGRGNSLRHVQLSGDPLVNGVAAEDVTDRSAVLWARATEGGTVRFELSLDPSFRAVIRRAEVESPGSDPVHVSFNNLREGAQY